MTDFLASWVDVVSVIVGFVAVASLWLRRKRPRFPRVVDPPRIDPANKVRAERMGGPARRMREAQKARRK